VGYDGYSCGPLTRVSPSEGVVGAALVLSREANPRKTRLHASLHDGDVAADHPGGALARRDHANAIAPMLALFDVLAGGGTEGGLSQVELKAGPGRVLRVEIEHV